MHHIASRVGVECLTAEARTDKAFLQDTNEITFSDEDIEVGYLDHRRPLYLAGSINQIPIKKALVDIGTSINLIPLNKLQAAGISESKIQRCLIEVTGFGGRGENHHRTHTAMAEGGPNSLFSLIPCGKDKILLSCIARKATAAQTPLDSIHLSPVCEREIEWKDDMDSSKTIPIRVGRGLFGRNHVLQRMGTVWRKFSI